MKGLKIKIKTATSGCYCCLLSCAIAVAAMILFGCNFVASKEGDLNTKSPKWNLTAADALRRDLFVNYNNNTHPLYKNQPTDISLGLSFRFINIDELQGRLTIHAWLRLLWNDDKLAWQPTEYSGLKTVHILPTEVWHPDIQLFNGADEKSNYIGPTMIILDETGGLLWVPPVVYTVYCNLDLQMWPFDTQTCHLKIGSWSLYNIVPNPFDDDDGDFHMSEWTFSGGSPRIRREDFYSYIEYDFKLSRRSTMYTAVIFVPAACIVLLSLAGFWLPPQMGEKILLNGIVIVIIAAFLMYFAQLLPVLAENTPRVVLFYSSSLLLASISSIIAVVVLYLSTAKHRRRVPEFIKNLLNGPMGTILCLSQFSMESELQSLLSNSTKELAENNYETPTDIIDPAAVNPQVTTVRSIQFDWVLLATAIDRIFFMVYCVVFFLLVCAYTL